MTTGVRRGWLSAVFALGLFASPACADGSETMLRLHGSNTLGEALAPAWAEAWMRTRGCSGVRQRELGPGHVMIEGEGDCELSVDLQTHGSSLGVDDLLSGRADLAMTSRPVTDREHARGLEAGMGDLRSPDQELVVALDGIAVIVHPDNPLRELSVAQVRKLFDGSARDWAEVGGRAGPVRVLARDDASGTFDTFRSLVLTTQGLREDAIRLESTRALIEQVAADPQAIGFAGFAGTHPVRTLAISDAGVAMQPEPFRIAVEDYPLSRRLLLYRGEHASELAADFERFVMSPQGQALVERKRFVSQEVRAYADSLRPDAPQEYRELVGQAQRLSLNFRFGQGRMDSKAAHDVERLAAFMGRPENRNKQLLLMGFVDPDEVSPLLAQGLSNDRVDVIADQLEAAGVPVARARGMGGKAPLAGGDGQAGRMRNRRVEVWISDSPSS